MAKHDEPEKRKEGCPGEDSESRRLGPGSVEGEKAHSGEGQRDEQDDANAPERSPTSPVYPVSPVTPTPGFFALARHSLPRPSRRKDRYRTSVRRSPGQILGESARFMAGCQRRAGTPRRARPDLRDALSPGTACATSRGTMSNSRCERSIITWVSRSAPPLAALPLKPARVRRRSEERGGPPSISPWEPPDRMRRASGTRGTDASSVRGRRHARRSTHPTPDDLRYAWSFEHRPREETRC